MIECFALNSNESAASANLQTGVSSIYFCRSTLEYWASTYPRPPTPCLPSLLAIDFNSDVVLQMPEQEVEY